MSLNTNLLMYPFVGFRDEFVPSHFPTNVKNCKKLTHIPSKQLLHFRDVRKDEIVNTPTKIVKMNNSGS